MPKDTKILKFPSPKRRPIRSGLWDDDFLDDPAVWESMPHVEDWQADDYYLDRKDYPRLVRLRTRRLAANPEDFQSRLDLAEAYVLAEDCDAALRILGPLHSEAPQHPDVQHWILQALFRSGRQELDFPWTLRPKTLHLGKTVVRRCLRLLGGAEGALTPGRLYALLETEGHLCFAVADLMNYLAGDPRFRVQEGWVHLHADDRPPDSSSDSD